MPLIPTSTAIEGGTRVLLTCGTAVTIANTGPCRLITAVRRDGTEKWGEDETKILLSRGELALLRVALLPALSECSGATFNYGFGVVNADGVEVETFWACPWHDDLDWGVERAPTGELFVKEARGRGKERRYPASYKALRESPDEVLRRFGFTLPASK